MSVEKDYPTCTDILIETLEDFGQSEPQYVLIIFNDDEGKITIKGNPPASMAVDMAEYAKHSIIQNFWSGPFPVTAEQREFRTKRDPEASGSTPQRGDRRYTLKFPLDDGTELIVHEGREGMNHFVKMISQMMMIDDDEEGLSGI